MADDERAGADPVTVDPVMADRSVSISHLPSFEKAKRANSFGEIASHYERYRPGPPPEAVDWMLSLSPTGRIVDLGAGTGALTRLLVDRADEVIAIEPDERMRSILVEEVPRARAIEGRGEAMPLPDDFAAAVLASSSWHWMDPIATLSEAGRVLVPGGVLGAVWVGPDPEGAFLVQAQSMLGAGSRGDDTGGSEISKIMMGEADRPNPVLEIPPGVPFDQPEHKVFKWDMALNADELIGLLGTFSWIITLPDETRERVIAEARRLLRDLLGLEGDATVDVAYRSETWRSRRNV